MNKNEQLTMIESQAADWLAESDRDGAAWPAERRAALEAWLAEATVHRVAFLRLQHAWQRADRLRALRRPSRSAQDSGTPRSDSSAASDTSPSAFDSLPQPQARSGMPLPNRWPARLMLGAATAVLGVALMVSAGLQPWRDAAQEQRHATARGQREAVALSDGSRLTLNTDTRLRTSVDAQHREVWLDKGEAFFDIAPDPARPFVVHAGAQQVTVLGTKFSLYREGDRLQVAVQEGRVQVQPTRAAGNRVAVLNRDDTALADGGNVLVSRQAAQQVGAALSWLQGKLVFDQVSLAEAARQFNRYNRKQLLITDEAVGRIAIGGVFDAHNAEAFARLLHAGFGLTVETVDDEIRVSAARAG